MTLTFETSPDAAVFHPGQFNMVYAFGVGEVPISLSGNPARAREIVHTIKAVGAVSQALCRLRAGSVVGLRGPYGRPWPMADVAGRDLVLVAGGLGLASLRPVVHHVLAHRRAYGEVSVLVGARTPRDLLFQRHLARWQARRDLRVLTIVDRAGRAWKGRAGVVPTLIGDLPVDPARAVAFVCGPEVMMRFAVRALAERGLPDEQMYVSLERNMKCAVGLCGRCQYGPSFVCKDGPVFRVDRIRSLLWLREA